jgi:hypothetical protein
MGVSASCVVPKCIECADNAGPSRDTHGVFICDGRELIWIQMLSLAKPLDVILSQYAGLPPPRV